MLTLVEFLLARIAEDEADARAATDTPWLASGDDEGNPVITTWGYPADPIIVHVKSHDDLDHIVRNAPARVLAECEAKRRIVEEHFGAGEARLICQTCWSDYFMGHEDFPCRTLRFLALPYADHPDYDESWKP